MNNITLIGNVTRNPESGTTQAGKNYTRFGLAVARAFNRDETDFFNLVAWGKTAEIIDQFVKVGHKVGVVGRIEFSEYEKDGVKRQGHSVIVNHVELLTSKKEAEKLDGNSSPENLEEVDGDLPF